MLVRPYLKYQIIIFFCFLRRFSFFYWKKGKRTNMRRGKEWRVSIRLFYYFFCQDYLSKLVYNSSTFRPEGKAFSIISALCMSVTCFVFQFASRQTTETKKAKKSICVWRLLKEKRSIMRQIFTRELMRRGGGRRICLYIILGSARMYFCASFFLFSLYVSREANWL